MKTTLFLVSILISASALAVEGKVTSVQCSPRLGKVSLRQVCEVTIGYKKDKLYFTFEKLSGQIEVYEASEIVPIDSAGTSDQVQQVVLTEIGRNFQGFFVADTFQRPNVGQVTIVRDFMTGTIKSFAGDMGAFRQVFVGPFTLKTKGSSL